MMQTITNSEDPEQPDHNEQTAHRFEGAVWSRPALIG